MRRCVPAEGAPRLSARRHALPRRCPGVAWNRSFVELTGRRHRRRCDPGRSPCRCWLAVRTGRTVSMGLVKNLMIKLHRRTGDRFMGMDLLYLTTVGAKSGEKRQSPVARFADGDAWLIAATNSGKPQHPSWYFNVRAHPIRSGSSMESRPCTPAWRSSRASAGTMRGSKSSRASLGSPPTSTRPIARSRSSGSPERHRGGYAVLSISDVCSMI